MTNTTQKVGIATLVGSYRNKKGNLVFRYAVKGSEAQLEAYKQAQGEFYRETDDGQALWFSSRNVGKRAELILTSNGKIIADMSEFDAAASLAAQYGGNLGQELAKHAASVLMGGSRPDTQPSTTVNDEADLGQS